MTIDVNTRPGLQAEPGGTSDKGIHLPIFVDLDWLAIAALFLQAHSSGQANFLRALTIILSHEFFGGNWPMMCRHIAEDESWTDERRLSLASQLETLADHLREGR